MRPGRPALVACVLGAIDLGLLGTALRAVEPGNLASRRAMIVIAVCGLGLAGVLTMLSTASSSRASRFILIWSALVLAWTPLWVLTVSGWSIIPASGLVSGLLAASRSERRRPRPIGLAVVVLGACASAIAATMVDSEHVAIAIAKVTRYTAPGICALYVVGLLGYIQAGAALASFRSRRFPAPRTVLAIVLALKAAWLIAGQTHRLPPWLGATLPGWRQDLPETVLLVAAVCFSQIVVVATVVFRPSTPAARRRLTTGLGVVIIAIMAAWAVFFGPSLFPDARWLRNALALSALGLALWAAAEFAITRRLEVPMLLLMLAGWWALGRAAWFGAEVARLDMPITIGLLGVAVDGFRHGRWIFAPERVALLIVSSTVITRATTWIPFSAESGGTYLTLTFLGIALRVVLQGVSRPELPRPLPFPDVFALSATLLTLLAVGDRALLVDAGAANAVFQLALVPPIGLWALWRIGIRDQLETGSPAAADTGSAFGKWVIRRAVTSFAVGENDWMDLAAYKDDFETLIRILCVEANQSGYDVWSNGLEAVLRRENVLISVVSDGDFGAGVVRVFAPVSVGSDLPRSDSRIGHLIHDPEIDCTLYAHAVAAGGNPDELLVVLAEIEAQIEEAAQAGMGLSPKRLDEFFSVLVEADDA